MPRKKADKVIKFSLVKKKTPKAHDKYFSWVEVEYPHLKKWQILAAQWIQGEVTGTGVKIEAMLIFIERYIAALGLPPDPDVFLARDKIMPDFISSACKNSRDGIRLNNHIHKFLDWVLLRDYSENSEYGAPIISPAFHNPIPHFSSSGFPQLDESVHSPLPYGYIDELRQMLAQGEHFKDWVWAQSVLGAELGKQGKTAPDWFKINEDQINHDDPDCVWRVRERSKAGGGPILEMWSPVRWVAILVKLILPLRTSQVRMIDSGEADTWWHEVGQWSLNTHRLAEGTESQPLQQGVFRRKLEGFKDANPETVLYINTNKTADKGKFGEAKGYEMVWFSSGPYYMNVFYWLEKLRDWRGCPEFCVNGSVRGLSSYLRTGC